ncbi:MAG: hypothetical protein UU12_C0020G0013 [Candidatus Woesebacteria bacterium GW2011_GWA2_40_7b]|uniref:Uncharacterized protein n=1 Tax=Candidatus Woesebacteria bacterium GW2011_GWA2_40_7b TaxID=1618563 RepID=A0A0G0W5E0_9BACT|nr:MAG: hypothetical protein UU12_C0020G0013 [Candidatus Woesebacteria bacterium GW2011_GWA2_40_7b]
MAITAKISVDITMIIVATLPFIKLYIFNKLTNLLPYGGSWPGRKPELTAHPQHIEPVLCMFDNIHRQHPALRLLRRDIPFH